MLASDGIEEAPLEAELLLRHVLKIDRVQLYLDFDRQPGPEQLKTFWGLIERRRKGEPSAYITGRREFCGLNFYVDPDVLIPRPETELLVEQAILMAQTRPVGSVADIGTGCGAIAISLATKLPKVKIYATDISVSALKVARLNCHYHGVAGRIHLLQGDLLEPLPEAVDLLMANLPYVRKAELARSGLANFEPALALDGGADGLEKIKRLCLGISGKLRPRGSLLLEIGRGQAKTVTSYLGRLFPDARIEITPDPAGIERVVSLRRT
ncbi:MAG: peptide chain release factor N(5)-glutamine methyltransferase [Chloroflexi bacterium]|nr:peptide chain release factor N(5)-glutamine methyltransferase [Chloroflexota bacterium]